jgi:hypothetical protein
VEGKLLKIEIDAKKICNSPKEDINGQLIDIDIDEAITQLTQQLIYGNNSCFLVSGYRGTGKTSLIRSIEKKLSSWENVVFVHLNFSKYEQYSLVLRKLIRETYLTLSKSKSYENIQKNNPKLTENIEKLYERTFSEVLYNYNNKTLKEVEGTLQIDINLKNTVKVIASACIVILASLNISLNLVSILSKYINIFILIASTLWFSFEVIKLSVKYVRRKTEVEEINRKTLYDDEIAEYHIKNILSQIKSENVKLIFVLDELDKIENEDEIEKIISDLKPLLLSNLASFIIISGQKLYYKFTNSNIIDDSVLSSIFSKVIHVSLSTQDCLGNVFNNCLINKDSINNELISKFRDSLILDSNRTLRRLFNLISQKIIWENNKSYLYIDDNDLEVLKTDSSLLNLIDGIVEKEIDSSDYDAGIKDFFTYQLYIWIKKMKLKGKVFFIKSDIYNFEEDYTDIYPHWCRSQLNEVCATLFNDM